MDAEILEGTVPQGKNDVQGAMMGVADFDWKASGSTILPGAICEHFTSFGGDLHKGAGQTPLSELLRYGAAAASGTVTEPYALAQKFPDAMMQVHYARGCTVAESFYQSIQCPYQLLIVGDPLCRPWADIPQVAVSGLPPTPNDPVQGEVRLKPQARFAGGVEVEHFEMYPRRHCDFATARRMARSTSTRSRLRTGPTSCAWRPSRKAPFRPGARRS